MVSSSIGLVGADDVESKEEPRPGSNRGDDSAEDDKIGEVTDKLDVEEAFDALRTRLPVAALLDSDVFPRGDEGVVLRSRAAFGLEDDLVIRLRLVSICNLADSMFSQRRAE